MKELMLLTDSELSVMVGEINKRRREMMTAEGKKDSQLWTLRLIDYLANSGYRLPDISKDRMAVVYADQLSEAIVIHGYDELQKVVREWVRNDTRQYKSFPTAGDILDAVKNMLGNPAAEIARREYEQKVNQIVAKERDELMKDVTPEQIEELERRYKR